MAGIWESFTVDFTGYRKDTTAGIWIISFLDSGKGVEISNFLAQVFNLQLFG
jgi:hypothetical protein